MCHPPTECAAWQGRGGHWNGIQCHASRQCAVDGGCLGGLQLFEWVTFDGSAEWSPWCALLARRCFRHWCMLGGYDSCWSRPGTFEGRLFPSHLRPPVSHVRICSSLMVRTSGFVAWHAEWIFDVFDARTLRFELALQTRAYAPDHLLSLHVMERSIYCDSARNVDRF